MQKEAHGKGRNRRRDSTRTQHKDKVKGGNNGHGKRRKRGGETTLPRNIRRNLHGAKITNTATKLVKVQRRKAHIPFCQQHFLSVCNEGGVHAGYPHRTWSPYTGQWTLPTSYHRLLSPHLEWCWYTLPFCRNCLCFKQTKNKIKREGENEKQSSGSTGAIMSSGNANKTQSKKQTNNK